MALTRTRPRYAQRTRSRYSRATRRRPPRRSWGGGRTTASPTSLSAPTPLMHSLLSSPSWPDIDPSSSSCQWSTCPRGIRPRWARPHRPVRVSVLAIAVTIEAPAARAKRAAPDALPVGSGWEPTWTVMN